MSHLRRGQGFRDLLDLLARHGRMDLSVQALGADHPDHEAVDCLTNLYHNLLREWSIT